MLQVHLKGNGTDTQPFLQSILRRFGLESTVRASLAFYNTPAEIDALVRRCDAFARVAAPCD